MSTASDRFAVSQSFRFQSGSAITKVLYGDENSIVGDRVYRFTGTAVVNTPEESLQKPVEIEVTDVSNGNDFEFSATKVPELEPGVEIVSINESSLSDASPEVNLITYSLRVGDDAQPAILTITDDPIPIVAWVAVAGIASLTGVSIYYVEKCKKVKLASSADLKEMKIETSVECDNAD